MRSGHITQRKHGCGSSHLMVLFILLLCVHAFAESPPLGGIPRVSSSIPGMVGSDRRSHHIRQDDTNEQSSWAATPTNDGTIVSTTASAETQTPTSSSQLVPRPFDASLGNNFTQSSCPGFFESFIDNETFVSCVPLSLLLQTSKGFFDAAMSTSTLTPVLDASCAAPFTTCNGIMTSLASQLISPSACSNDYALGNPLVVQAYRGLLSYAPMYQAGCVKADPVAEGTGDGYPFCYASAVNSSSQGDSELYFLPLGEELPSGTSVSCSSCTQRTMAIFATTAVNTSSPLNKVYYSAASMVDSTCGKGFVNATSSGATSTSNSAANSTSKSPLLPSFLGICFAAFGFICFI